MTDSVAICSVRMRSCVQYNELPLNDALAKYREDHLLGLLGLVDFDFGCFTLCMVLLGLMGNWQHWLSN